MKDENYQWLAKTLLAESGLVLGEDKLHLLNARLASLVEKSRARDLDQLVEELKQGSNRPLLVDVVEAMTTHETSFFREARSFEVLFERILPRLTKSREKTKSIRVWSAACSSGQEPYSLIMGIDHRVPALRDWKIEIVATDLSDKLLERARQGLFNHFEVQRGLPMRYLIQYFAREGKNYRLLPGIRSQVSFQKQNLKESLAHLGGFDVIFCRNVLSYFDVATKRDILDRMADVLAPDGYLLLGGGESIVGVTGKLRRIDTQDTVIYCNAATNPNLVDVV